MKKLLMCLVVIPMALSAFTQSPQKMNYQCIVRNESGVLMIYQSIGLKISILQYSSTGTVVYQEIYDPNPKTNANGLVSIEIGSGSPNTGVFSTINWSNGPYFLKTEIDPAGGTNYTIVGTSQLLSVPYALYAKTSETSSNVEGLKQQIKILEDNLIEAGTYKLTDIDGNQYNTVKIGTQVWLKENLKTTKYNDGTAIPLVTDNSTWVANLTGAYCDYENNTANSDTYGKLYNWYVGAYNNTKNVCPTGWHVPSNIEWITLYSYMNNSSLFYDNITNMRLIAKSLAANSFWASSTITGVVGNTDFPEYRNKTGFTAFPAGLRGPNGIFTGISYQTYFWSINQYTTAVVPNLWGLSWTLDYDRTSLVYVEANGKDFGFSVRCLKDN